VQEKDESHPTERGYHEGGTTELGHRWNKHRIFRAKRLASAKKLGAIDQPNMD